jgi:UDP-glucose 4-epimerase
MRIGITGGNGFIGGYVAEEAVRRGHSVVVVDRRGNVSGPVGELLRRGVAEMYLGDVLNVTDMMELAAHVDGIVHLAACLGTQETIANPVPAAETNVMGGINFLQAVAQYDIPGVYIGVGNHWMENSYSITKTTIERFVRMYNVERGTRINVVRVVNAYGPRQSVAPPYGPAKVRKITPAFICRVLTGTDIEIYGDGEQISDMVSVRDAARALVTALERAAVGVVFPCAVEVGPAPERSTTVLETARSVIRAATTHGFTPVGIKHLPMRPGEIPGSRVSADVSTLQLVGLDPGGLIKLDDGIAETVAWFADNWLPSWQAEQETAAAHERSSAEHVCTPECNPGNCARQDF